MKSERSFWLAAALIFTLIAGITYFPALFGKVPLPRDMVLQFPAWQGMARSEPWQSYGDIGDLITAFYPFRAFAARAVREGAIPLWNPYFLGGAPFLASPQSSLFYPPNFLYYIFALPTAWTLCIVIRLFLSGMFMTLFVRHIGGTRAGSIFAGIVLSLCGFMTAWQGQPMDDGAAWLPFICYSVIRLRKEPSGRSIALAAFGFAMPVLAGHPEAAAHVTLVGIALALFMFVCSRADWRFLLKFTAAGLLAFGLASIQIVPTLEWLGQMPGALDIRWPPLPFDRGFGWVSRDILHAPNSAGVWIPEGAAYAGMMTLVAAPLGLLHRSRKLAAFLAGLTLAAFGIAYGFEPMHWLARHTPVLAGLKNGRMILIAGFGLAALAGLGVSALEEDVPFSRHRRAVALAAVTAAFLSTFVLVYRLQLATQFRVQFTHRPSFSRSLLFAGVILILWRLYGGLRGRVFPIAACAVIAFDLLTFSYRYTGFAGRDEIFPRAPVFEFLAKNADPAQFRIAEMGVPYSANANIVYGIASGDGYEVRFIPAQRSFSSDYNDNPSGLYFTPSLFLRFNDRRLDMLNVKYLVAAGRSPEFDLLNASPRFALAYNNSYVAVFENKSVLPRAFAVPAGGVQLVDGSEKQLETLRNPAFDPNRAVLVSAVPPSLKDSVDASPPNPFPFSSNVALVEGGINEISFRTSTSLRAVLVVSQTYYPGWKATVDGNETEVFPANLTLTGVALPAGVHEVRLAFRPTSFKIGAALSLISCLILAAMAGIVLKTREASSTVVG